MLSLVFGFNDDQPIFNLNNYLLNLLKFFILSLIVLLIHNFIQKFYSDKIGAFTELKLWSSNPSLRFGRFKSKFYFPNGIIFPLLITILSLGQIYFTAPVSTEIQVKPAYRIGKKFTRLTEFELAKVASVAPLTHIILAVILNLFSIPLLKDLALINTMLSLSLMLPLPGLLGSTIFFSSKPLYIFTAIFILTAAIFSSLISSIYALIIALIFGIVALVVYLYRYYK